MRFRVGEFTSVIERLAEDTFSGTVSLVAKSGVFAQQTYILTLWQGDLTFVGTHLPSPREFVDLIKDKLQLHFIDASIKVAEKRMQNPKSVRELLDFLNRFNLFQWDKLETVMQQELAISLESLLLVEGEWQIETNQSFDLSYGKDQHGLAWDKLQTEIAHRQTVWQSLRPFSLESVPIKGEITDIPIHVLEHLNTWVNGTLTLGKIAVAVKQDPLKLAESYSQWQNQHWLKLLDTQQISAENTPISISASAPMPVVLSVDDSAIVQISIKRAISDCYQVICAKSALEALQMLSAQPVDLILLDVTMPDIDGLELCRTIRNINKFKNLPIVMLTAKDGLMDKVKGQFVGSTHYLAKPVDREKLLPILEKYIPVAPAII